MLRYIGQRLVGAIPVLWGVATLVFVIMRLLPGDPAALMLSEAGASAEAIAQFEKGGFAELVEKAVVAAYEKAKKLGS